MFDYYLHQSNILKHNKLLCASTWSKNLNICFNLLYAHRTSMKLPPPFFLLQMRLLEIERILTYPTLTQLSLNSIINLLTLYIAFLILMGFFIFSTLSCF